MAGYGSDSAFDGWLTANGYALPDGAPDKGVLRERASIYIDGLYGSRFSGRPTGGAAQEREWPRVGAVDRYGNALASDAVPSRVEQATYQAAFLEATTKGGLSATYTPGTQKVLTEVKGIKWTVTGDASKDGAMVPVSTAVEAILAPLLTPADFPAIMVV